MSVFHNWLLDIASGNYFIYIKRLSANDTGATGGHQVGLYIPSNIVEKLFPSINHTRELNPSVFLTAHVSSHDCPDTKHAQFITTTVILVRPETKKELRAGGEEVHYRTLKIQEPSQFLLSG